MAILHVNVSVMVIVMLVCMVSIICVVSGSGSVICRVSVIVWGCY